VETKRSPLKVEDSMGDEITHDLVYRFWNLASSQRREIRLELGLIEKNEMSLSEPERYGRAFKRAKDRDLVIKLAIAIAKRERQNDGKK
jgi:hypothetical protein